MNSDSFRMFFLGFILASILVSHPYACSYLHHCTKNILHSRSQTYITVYTCLHCIHRNFRFQKHIATSAQVMTTFHYKERHCTSSTAIHMVYFFGVHNLHIHMNTQYLPSNLRTDTSYHRFTVHSCKTFIYLNHRPCNLIFSHFLYAFHVLLKVGVQTPLNRFPEPPFWVDLVYEGLHSPGILLRLLPPVTWTHFYINSLQ